jgi:hypothetical protein
MEEEITYRFNSGVKLMYNNAIAGAAPAGAGLLAATGPGMALWVFLAGFAMLATGMAIARIVPKTQA